MKHVTMRIGVVLLTGAALVLGSCAGAHKMREGSGAEASVCRECYDQAVRTWDQSVYGYAGGRWGYVPSTRVYAEHHCASCNSTMVVHTDDGRWTIQCPTCAPEGVPCDKCLPR